MALTLGISIGTSVAVILSVLLFPQLRLGRRRVNTYWLLAVLGAALLLISGRLAPGELWQGLTAPTAVNPLKILTLFLSMTLLSVQLDEAGFFGRLASVAAARAGGSQRRLFFSLYLTVSVLTVFTSNDIVILTFTPFICYFAAAAKIDPLPYLIAEFVAANTWSMLLIIGNPTNLYLAGAAGVSFFAYTRMMWLPALLGGGVSLGILWLLFRKNLRKPLTADAGGPLPADGPLMRCGLINLGGCLICLVLSSFTGWEMWWITLAFAASDFLVAGVICLIRRRGGHLLWRSVQRAPFEMVPFVLSMFTLVLALEKGGAGETLADFFSLFSPVWGCGIASFLAANAVNNIPMSVLFSAVIPHMGVGQTAALYAAVIGSNVGAFLTPVGALAGMMWTGMLRDHEVKLSFGGFVKYGAAVAVPTLTAALAGLCLAL